MENSIKEDELLWDIVKLKISENYYLVENHLNSFNFFIKNDLKDILEKKHLIHIYIINNIIYKNIIEISNIKISEPNYIENNKEKSLSIEESILRDLTYESSLYATVTNKLFIINDIANTENIHIIDSKEMLIARIPIMIKSKLSKNNKNEIGGYFIINGKEKVFVNQERLCYNRIYLFNRTINEKKYKMSEVSSFNKSDYSLYKLAILLDEENIFTVNINLFSKKIKIPVLFLLKLLGFHDNIEIYNNIKLKNADDLFYKYKFTLFNYNFLMNSNNDSIIPNFSYNTSNIYLQILQYIENNELKKMGNISNQEIKIYIDNYLETKLLPHLGNDFIKKGFYICHMINKLILFDLDLIEETDRDSYGNKRLMNCNDILKFMFNYSFNLMLVECTKLFNARIEDNINNISKPESVLKLLKNNILYDSFISLFTVGEIVFLNLSGVFQTLKGDSYIDKLNHLRLLKTNIGNKSSTSKILEPRYLHNSQFGYICPVETPEGKQVGLVKTFSLLTISTIENLKHEKILFEKIKDLYINFTEVDHFNYFRYNLIIIDGDIIGFVENSFDFFNKFIKMRRNNEIYWQYSIYINYETLNIYIQTDSGRLMRPLLIVEENKLKLDFNNIGKLKTFYDYIKKNIIEYIDVEESYNLLISLNYGYIRRNNNIKNIQKNKINTPFHFANYHLKNYTHCEIHPLTILGISANCLIFLDHNQAPKNTSTCKYIKQAIGIYNTNYRKRFDVNSFILTHPQKPLIESKLHNITSINKIPTGQNIILAIACYSGFNQEDSVIFNRKAIERGLFNIFNYTSYTATLKYNQTNRQSEKFIKPSEKYNKIKKNINYEKLNIDGFIDKEIFVEKNDVIIGKISPIINDKNKYNFVDSSIVLKNIESGIVDNIVSNIYNYDNNEICKVKLRNKRNPKIGDKFCYDDKTEILTKTGWKYFKNLKCKDKIAILDNFQIKYESSNEIISFENNEELILCETDNINYCITQNHKLYVKVNNKFKLVEANQLYNKYKKFNTKSIYNNKLIVNNNLLLLYSKLIKIATIGTKCCFIEKSEYIINLLNKLKINFVENKLLLIININLYHILKTKLINLPTCYIKKFIKNLFENNTFCTKCEKIKNIIQQLVIHSGCLSKCKKIKNIYSINLINNSSFNPNKDIEKKIKYTGVVYCCSTRTGIICVRRNGITMWNGNSNRSGQKYTLGLILDQVDMPFTDSGITPDIIMNPHAIPTRCSMGQFLEGLLAKVCAIEGHFSDGSNFSNIDVKKVGAILEKYGFNKSGTEKLRCGFTGKQLESDIYIGPLYNFRLKHMTEDRIQTRGTSGPIDYISRQPPKGRNKGGAVKMGEMERDCLIAHGISQFIQEKYVETLEKYKYSICNKCGILANKVIDTDLYICPLCDSNTTISNINIPYNFKLLQQELLSLKVKTTFELE